MLKKIIALALAVLLNQAIVAAAPASEATRSAQDAPSVEQVKGKVARAGLGEKARVTVWIRDGAKLKGYVSEARDAEFVIRDRKTDAPTTVRYSDVSKLDINRGHSTAKGVGIGIAAGVGAVVLVLGILFATLDD